MYFFRVVCPCEDGKPSIAKAEANSREPSHDDIINDKMMKNKKKRLAVAGYSKKSKKHRGSLGRCIN